MNDAEFLRALLCKPHDAVTAVEMTRLFSIALRASERLYPDWCHTDRERRAFDAGRATLSESKSSTPLQSSYEPLTREQVEGWRKKIKDKIFSDFCGEPNEAHGRKLQADFDRLCSMAVNALLYAEEIERLRTQSENGLSTEEYDALVRDAMLWRSKQSANTPIYDTRGEVPIIVDRDDVLDEVIARLTKIDRMEQRGSSRQALCAYMIDAVQGLKKDTATKNASR